MEWKKLSVDYMHFSGTDRLRGCNEERAEDGQMHVDKSYDGREYFFCTCLSTCGSCRTPVKYKLGVLVVNVDMVVDQVWRSTIVKLVETYGDGLLCAGRAYHQ